MNTPTNTATAGAAATTVGPPPRRLWLPAGPVDVTTIAGYSDIGITDRCGSCGGEGVHEGVLDIGAPDLVSVACADCGATGMAAPAATRLQRAYTRYMDAMTLQERVVVTLAVKVIGHHELAARQPHGGDM